MMDIVERLRNGDTTVKINADGSIKYIKDEAADEIERLQRENERLQKVNVLYVEAVEKLKVIIDKQSDEIERLLEALQYIAEVNPQCVGGIRVPIEAARDALKERE